MLVTSGREVSRRLGAEDAEAAASTALLQMRELHMLPGAAVQLDVTPPAAATI